MTTLARLSFRGAADQQAAIQAAYAHRLKPILDAHQLTESSAPKRPVAEDVFSRLFAVDSPAALEARKQALRQDPAWRQALQSLPTEVVVDDVWDVYRTPARMGERVTTGSGTTVAAGEGRLVNVGLGFAQGGWQSFGLDDGMPSHIHTLLQDGRGALWIGSWAGEGLFRYDGAQLRRFTVNDGLPDDEVNCLLEDTDKRLWIGTKRGVVRYDGRNFTTFTDRDGLADEQVLALLQTRSGDLWIGTERGVMRYDGQTFTRFTCHDGLPLDRVACLAEDRSGGMWCGAGWTSSGGGAVRYDGRDFTCFTVAEGLPNDWVIALLVERSGSLWLGTAGGVGRWDGRRFATAFTTDQSRTMGGVMAMCQDREDRLWCAVWGQGAWRYDGGAPAVFTTQDGLAADTTTSLLADRDGQLWVGTAAGGLSRYNGQRLETYTSADGLLLNDVGSLYKDRRGRLWIGSRHGMNYRDETGLGVVEQMRGLSVAEMLEDRQGRLWFEVWGKGVARWDGQCLDIFTPEKVTPNNIYATPLLEDGDGRLWFVSGGNGGGINTYADGDWTSFDAEIGLVHHEVSCIHQDADGLYWFGGTGGVSRWDGSSFRLFTVADGLPHRQVYCLLADGRGHLWIGTKEGLCHYDGQSFSSFAADDSLRSRNIRGLQKDGRGCLWIITAGGVYRYDGLVCLPLSRSDGLLHGAVKQVIEDCNSTVWLATGNGLARYRPATNTPRVQILAVIADREYGAGEDVCFSVAQKQVEFVFKGCSLSTRPDDLAYAYSLEGHDAGWRAAYANRVAYRELVEGDYVFKVRAIDRDLNYSATAELRVRVEPDTVVESLKATLAESGPQGEFVGKSAALRRVLTQLGRVAPADLTVLVLGETGTGKGLAARTLHHLGPRRHHPFVLVNCGGMPDPLVESELFGHEKGAFTGAVARRLGKVELAGAGTLFLDEIGDLSPAAQVKLLRLLEERSYERVGGTQVLTTEARVVAATNRDLHRLVQEGAFREDLYFRLQGFEIRLPPLRQRKEDIPLLALYFIGPKAAHLNKPVTGLSRAAEAALVEHDWPGNVRELMHVIETAVVVCAGEAIQIEDLQLGKHNLSVPHERVTLEEYERRYIQAVLQDTGGVISGPRGAARILGLNEGTLRSRMKKLGIKRPLS